MNLSEDDVFNESDDEDGTPSVFSQTLNRFKKSPKKKGRLDNYCPAYMIDNSSSYSPSYEKIG